MNLTLHLTPETEAALNEQANLTGKTPEAVVLEALQEKLLVESAPTVAVSPEEWMRQFDDWVSGHKSRNPSVDDSRESIYPDR